MEFEIAQLFRRFENLIRIGTIAELDYENKKLRVKTGELITDWLPWPAEIGKNFKRWRPLREGTQVVLACPSGDTAQALIISMLYSNAVDSPLTDAEGNIDLIQFDDGTKLEYDSSSSTLTVDATSKITIKASEMLTLEAPNISIKGEVTQTDGDITSDGISVQKHTHKQTKGDDFGAGGITEKPK